jgi:DNA-binding beta-propeller fold protein YncE
MISQHGGFGLALCLTVLSTMPGRAQTVGATVPAGGSPQAVAVNTVTNKTYVANYLSGNITAIDGSTNSTTTVPAGLRPVAVAVNEATNRIYVANHGDALQWGGDPGNVTVIDGATGSTTTVIDPNASVPNAVAVNSVTNKIYVANFLSSNITVIDGDTNATTTITDPNAANLTVYAIAVNEMTNKIYVANNDIDRPVASPGSITVLDGVTNSTTTITDPKANTPNSLAVNPVTNKIYVTNVGNGTGRGSITLIDGATNSTTNITDANLWPGIDSRGFSVAVNSVTNKVYVADEIDSTLKSHVTVIDGGSNSVTTITDPSAIASVAVAVDSNTNTIYIANGGCLLLSGCNDPGSVSVIDGATDSFSTLTDPNANAPLAVAVNPVTNTIYTANAVSGNVTVINGSAGTSNLTLSVTLAGNGSGTVTSNPPGIDCGGSCSASFAPGTSVTLTVAPMPTSNFTGWGGACSGTGTCIVTINADVSVTANFTSEDFSLQPAPVALALQPGTQGTDVIAIAGVNGSFGGAVQLSCVVTGPAPMPTCALSPASVTPGANSANSTLTISDAAMSTRLAQQAGRLQYALWLPLIFGITPVAAPKRQRHRYCSVCVWFLSFVLLQTACSGGHGVSPTNYTVAVTGTSGSIQHTTQVKVTVQ